MSFATASAAPVAVGICCVNYCDFLRHTLPQALRFFTDVTVITSTADQDSIQHARALGATTWLSELWFEGGAAFNKSAAINQWLATRSPGWTLLLDADTYLPDEFNLDLTALNPANLYSVPRRICELEWDWVGPKARRPEYPLLIPPVKNGRVWRRPTKNPAALSGYFHLWNRAASNHHYYPGSTTAAEYDVEFALQFPEENRHYLPGEVIHLGPVRQNWSGRISTPWSLIPEDASLIPDSLKSIGATRIYRFKIGSRNPTFLCTSPDEAWVYRTVPATFAWQVQKETYVQQTLRNVPVPRVLSISESAYVMEYGGLTSEGLRVLPVTFFSACGQILRNLHEESLDPAKLFQARYAKASWDSMFGYHLRLSQCARWLGRIPTTSALVNPLRTLLDRMESDTSVQDAFAASRFCFTHGDYKTANILTDGTQPTNVIDFEHAVYGDPDSDLHWFCQRALSEGYSRDHLKAFVDAYGLGSTFSRKRNFYRYFRAFQKVILTSSKEQPALLGWVEAIRDGSDPYLQCELV